MLDILHQYPMPCGNDPFNHFWVMAWIYLFMDITICICMFFNVAGFHFIGDIEENQCIDRTGGRVRKVNDCLVGGPAKADYSSFKTGSVLHLYSCRASNSYWGQNLRCVMQVIKTLDVYVMLNFFAVVQICSLVFLDMRFFKCSSIHMLLWHPSNRNFCVPRWLPFKVLWRTHLILSIFGN